MQTHYDYVLVGGGVACVWAAQSLRELDKNGSIVIFKAENYPPYDRPPLSKKYLLDDDTPLDDAYTKFDNFYPDNRIDLRLNTQVTGVDPAAKTVTLADGEIIGYGKLLLATGARPNALTIPGFERPGVHVLRTLDDSLAIRESLKKSRRVVIIGAGYIGLEVGANARQRGLEVTIVEPQGYPWARFASPALGDFLTRYYTNQGVRLLFHDGAASIEGEGANGPVQAVITRSGQRLPADMVVAGVGVTLNLELAQAAGLEVDPKDGVMVDEFLQTSHPDIFAAGDIACFPDLVLGRRWHVEHHLNAKWQGQTAGKVMAGQREPYRRVPYFFSDELDLHMILRGDPQSGKNAMMSGDVEGAEFVELYSDDSGRLTMGIAVSRDEKKLDDLSDTLERLILAGVNLKGREADLQQPGFDVNSLG